MGFWEAVGRGANELNIPNVPTGSEEAWRSIKDFYRWEGMESRFIKKLGGPGTRRILGEGAGQFFHGASAAVWPVSFPDASGIREGTTKGIAKVGGKRLLAMVGRGAKWLGPAITAYRIGTEEISHAPRIAMEEGGSWGGFAAGAWAGAAIGTALLPVGGTAVGGIIGGLIGAGIGHGVGSTVADIVEAPFKVTYGSLNYLRKLGRSSRQLELGGRQSAAFLSGAAYTMRSRALQEINRSGINARSILGQEAQYQHFR